eukprot:4729803-Alexandrium_andersonii.AAC.1
MPHNAQSGTGGREDQPRPPAGQTLGGTRGPGDHLDRSPGMGTSPRTACPHGRLCPASPLPSSWHSQTRP